MVALPNSKFSAKNFPVAPGGAKSGGALPKLRILCPKTAIFGPKGTQNPVITAKPRQTVHTLHVRHHCPVNKSPFLPSSSTYVRETAQKWPKMANCALFVLNTAKAKNGSYLGLRGSKPSSEGAYSTRNLPLFVVSQPQNHPTRSLHPRTSGHFV